jgi:hypothetical protein
MRKARQADKIEQKNTLKRQLWAEEETVQTNSDVVG